MTSDRKSGVKWAIAAGILVILLGGIMLLAMNPREPQYNGIGLSRYIEEKIAARQFPEAVAAARATGEPGVRYLAHEMRRDPLAEFEMKVAPHCPLSVFVVLAKQTADYQSRRGRASFILEQLGTDAASALPEALRILETDGPRGPRYNCLGIVSRLAPRTKYEDRAINALTKIAESGEREERRTAVFSLITFTNHAARVAPVLVRALKRPGMFEPCAAALMRMGEVAIPALKEEAAQEKFQVQPATVVLERMRIAVGDKQ